MGYSRQLYLSDCACRIIDKPCITAAGVVDESTSARRKISSRRSTSFLEAIDGDQTNDSRSSCLRPYPEDVCSWIPVQNGSLIVCGRCRWALQIVDMQSAWIDPIPRIHRPYLT